MLTVDYHLLGIRDGERVLDIGCGPGRHSWEACRQTDCLVYALDIEGEELTRAKVMLYEMDKQGESRGRWVLIKGNTLSLPFKDASFDKIICSEVLEHVPDDRQSIKEIARVLKDSGIIAISVPTYLPEAICWKLSRDYHDCPGGHVRIYKIGELLSPLRQNNLHIYATRRKFLVWDIKTKSKPIRLLEDFLNHFFPKSVVFYACKNQK